VKNIEGIVSGEIGSILGISSLEEVAVFFRICLVSVLIIIYDNCIYVFEHPYIISLCYFH
jgi:hypothetical protein